MRMWVDEIELSPMERQLIISDMEITVEERTASGRLVSDLKAIKKRFTINYKFITNEILEQLATLYQRSGARAFKLEQEDESIDEYLVKFRPFSRARHLIGKEWYWDSITLELEEI